MLQLIISVLTTLEFPELENFISGQKKKKSRVSSTVLANVGNCMTVMHTHTHPFNGPFSGTIQVSRYQKGKTNLDFTEARDSEWQ